MKASDEVFRQVAEEADSRRFYSYTLHGRVHDLVLDYLDSAAWVNVASAISNAEWDRQVDECSEWVEKQYRKEYGVPLVTMLLWPLISALISFIVQSTLSKLFGRQE